MTNRRISICIPTYEYHGLGVEYLSQLLNSISSQSFTDFDIIISDQSKNSDIKNSIKTYKNLDIKYIKSSSKYNSVSNTNYAIKNASGHIIKIIFQDDLFVRNDALEKINQAFESGCKWLVSGCNHTSDGKTFYRNIYPRWNDNIIFGKNTIGAPSVLSFINKDVKKFDENGLITIMDCEYYFQLYKEYGLPYTLDDIQIGIRMCDKSVSTQPGGYLHSGGNPNLQNEIDYVISKHKLNVQ